jgi:hypothetical protein
MNTMPSNAVQSVPTGTTSLSDLLTALKNLVVAVNALTQTYTNVMGALNASAIAATTLVKSGAGRIAVLSVTSAGSTPGLVYDGATLTALTKPIGVIPNTTGTYTINLPVSFGLIVSPGTGQVVTVGYS